MPSATPTDLANFSAPGSTLPQVPSAPTQGNPDSLSQYSNPSNSTAPRPAVPADLMDDAASAKDSFERGQYRDAERTYEKMLTEAPNNVYILSNLGVVYFRNDKSNLAEESLKKAIAVAPEDVFSWCTLGIVYYQEKRFDDAINSLTRALAIDPKYAVAHNYLGITASQKGWQDASIKELETAIDLDPNYGDACFNLAVVYAMENPPNKDLARKYYQRAISLGAEPDQGLEQLLK
jgi:Tfp pilus assembly protein PilF